MPAGGPKKIGVEFSGQDVNYDEMVSAWLIYQTFFF